MTVLMRSRRRLRRVARRYPVAIAALPGLAIFAAAFGGAYGFISGRRADGAGYDPQAVAASVLFALACVAIAGLGLRLRRLNRKFRVVALHNEALADRNWGLREAEERARALFEAQGDLIVIRTADGVIADANDAVCALAGIERAALVGSRFAFAPLSQSVATIAPDGARIFDQDIATASGPRTIAWRETLLRNESGHGPAIQCVGRDVTDRVETGRVLAQARDQARAASEAKSRFLAMASHEIRTPLNGIIGMSGLLLDTALSPEQATYAKAVKTSGDALLALIEDLLDYSRIEAGKLDLDIRPFALGALVEDVVELLAPRAEARRLEIATCIDERLPAAVIGDAARLRQVLLNLAGNAIKFTPEGGVAVIVEPGERAGDIRFLVRDTGIGIAPDAQSRIFRDFEQADAQTARAFGGTGLGLGISERIVRRMNGQMVLDSTPGVGSTFSVTLPLPAAPGETAQPPSFAAPDLTGRAILLVAPQTIETSLVATRLQRWGAQTCAVADIDVAMALLPERAWHAVMIDRGFQPEQIGRLADAARPHATKRIVMVTPATRHDLASLPAAFTGYLVKPLRAASLATRLAVDGDIPSPPIAAETPVEENSARRRKRGLSVLVAEDNEINALLIRALLTRLGHEAVITGDGDAAVESWLAADAAGAPYDLVLMDIQMPGTDGVEATKRIRKLEAGRHSRTPVIALTANTLIADRYACFEAGMDGFLIKPLDRDKLAAALAELRSETPVAA